MYHSDEASSTPNVKVYTLTRRSQQIGNCKMSWKFGIELQCCDADEQIALQPFPPIPKQLFTFRIIIERLENIISSEMLKWIPK